MHTFPMGKLFQILFFRGLTRFIGKYTRYYYFKLIGQPRTLKNLSNEYKDDYKDLGNALNQDLTNAIVGTVVLIPLILLIVWLVYK